MKKQGHTLFVKEKRKGYGLIMSKKKVKLSGLTPQEQLKYEIAEELGLLDKVMENGWKALSAKETGRIGGLMTKRKKELNKKGME